MKILITGNLGYVGSELTKSLRKTFPESTLIGYDIGYYAKYLTNNFLIPEVYLDSQIYGDVCELPADILKGVDTVIQLAAISNDPIGNKFEEVTYKVNHKAVVEIAEKAKKQGVKNIIFASSCSVYGFAEESERTEQSEVGPITAYAKSKVYAEKDLETLACDNFKITCLRFATACGISDRLRLDLVLNDFVAGALTSKEITILSDGTPWRPLINVKDMARAIIWAHLRKPEEGGNFLTVNTGSNEWNYQVKNLAKHINDILPEIKVTINKDAQPDKRSYKVNFDLFNKLSRNYQPEYDINTTIKELIDGLNAIEFRDKNFRKSKLMRLNVINELIEKGIIDSNLKFRK